MKLLVMASLLYMVTESYQARLLGLPSKAPGSAQNYNEAILPWLSQHQQLGLARMPSPNSTSQG